MHQERQGSFFLWQRFLHVEIFRKSEDLLQVDLFFQETSREDRLKLELSIRDFTVKNAVLERPRSNQGTIQPLSLLFLHGRSIYLKEAKNLKKTMLEWGETVPCVSNGAAVPRPSLQDREHYADLLLELIADVLQAEVFILGERGIPSVEEYDRYFNEMYGDMCVLYSELRGRVPEYAYTQGQQRSDSLFSRHSSIFIFQHRDGEGDGKGDLSIHGHLCDSFHEMALSLSVSPSSKPPYLINRAEGNFLRFPNPVCGKAAVKLQELAGVHLHPENKKKILSALTGQKGCSHLGDLALEAAKALLELNKQG